MIRPEKVVLHLSFPHPVYGTFTPIKLEYHQFIDRHEEEMIALDGAKYALEEWFKSRYGEILEASKKEGVIREEKKDIVQYRSEVLANINACDTLEALVSFKLIAASDKELMTAYMNKLKKIEYGRD